MKEYTFQFGVKNNKKIYEIKAPNRDYAIAVFEREYPDLYWTYTKAKGEVKK
jgi:hypothetical protein